MAADPDTRHLIVFRPMVEADLDAVVDNEMHAYGFPWTREVFRDCLRSNRHCWVACLGEDVVGHAVVAVGAAQSHLLNVCIRRRSQGLPGLLTSVPAAGVPFAVAVLVISTPATMSAATTV